VLVTSLMDVVGITDVVEAIAWGPDS